MELKGQDFGEYQQGLGFYLHNALPMSERYADAVRESFSLEHSDVRFSLRDTGQQMEKAEQIGKDSYQSAGNRVENAAEQEYNGAKMRTRIAPRRK